MTPVRWSVALPTDQVGQRSEFISVEALAEMAAALESAGVDACHVTDHPYPPEDWVAQGGHHALDPLVALSCVATATHRLRLHSHVFVAAYRNPILAAHGIATLDALSGGRVILGVAAGYLRSEFEGLGVDYAHRGTLLDIAINQMKAAWAGGRGPEGNALQPVPVSHPHPPIWIGGNSGAAMRRAVKSGQGWAPFPAPPALAKAAGTTVMANLDDLGRALAILRAKVDESGRGEPIDVCCTPFSHPHHRGRFDPERLVEEAALMAEMGVTWLTLRLPAPSRAAYLENVERFGAEVAGRQ
jgi:probable F420-dependent oxidoreductase